MRRHCRSIQTPDSYCVHLSHLTRVQYRAMLDFEIERQYPNYIAADVVKVSTIASLQANGLNDLDHCAPRYITKRWGLTFLLTKRLREEPLV